MHHRTRTVTLGWILLLIGGLLLLNHWYPISLDWTTFLMILGIALFLIGLVQRNHDPVLPGTLIFFVGLLFYLKAHTFIVISWWQIWPLLTICVGIAFLVHFILNPEQKGFLFPGPLLIIMGFFFLFFPWSWWCWEITYWFGRLWPVILIIVGIYLILKSAHQSKERI